MTAFRSPGLKMLGLALLALLLLIPLARVELLIGERQRRALDAETSIAQQWGGSQRFAPAYLVANVPVEVPQGSAFVVRPQAHVLLPDRVDVRGTIATEVRARGMFAVPVYTAKLAVTARFAADDVAALRAKAVDGATLRLRFALEDPRGVRAVGPLAVDGVALRPVAIGRHFGGLSAFGADVPDAALDGDLVVEYETTLAGVRRLELLALGRTTEAALAGAWLDPSFVGAFLPAEREVGAAGFRARWQVLEFNRDVPQTFALDGATLAAADRFAPPIGAATASTIELPGFGVDLYQPADVYQQNERSGKYGIVVLALMFAALFLFEIIGGVALHPIQYLLVGLALATFYLLLLALSEHAGFAPAYGLAALVSVGVVAGYARAVLRTARRAALLGALQTGAYAVFFVLVRSEEYALLLGALALFAVLALIMYLTRNLDWFTLGRPGAPAAQTP
jgi:inner membrane protein